MRTAEESHRCDGCEIWRVREQAVLLAGKLISGDHGDRATDSSGRSLNARCGDDQWLLDDVVRSENDLETLEFRVP